MNEHKSTNQGELEDRKKKEIEHSRKRRDILQGFERYSDTNASQENEKLDEMIKDPWLYEFQFSNMKYYSIIRQSEKHRMQWLKENCDNTKKILDFACGSGENGISAAELGANCTGIDISPEGVANAQNNAKMMGVDDHCKFMVMDGENMDFNDSSFNLGIEYGALHHVDLDKALSELARVLDENGKMLCVEAIRHNPIIHYYRKKTPHLRTQWEYEHILGVESFELMKKHFHEVEVKFYHLVSLLVVPFRKTFLFKWLLPITDFFDKLLLSNQLIGKYGWIMIIELKKPRKN